jgi:hypothetical protein
LAALPVILLVTMGLLALPRVASSVTTRRTSRITPSPQQRAARRSQHPSDYNSSEPWGSKVALLDQLLPSRAGSQNATEQTLAFIDGAVMGVDAIYQRFGGLSGSAYFVGGFGMTALTANDVVVVPIRSGLGLRLGANLGYLKFTPQSTWNPF